MNEDEKLIAAKNAIWALDPVSDEQIVKCWEDCIQRLKETPPIMKYVIKGKDKTESGACYGIRLIQREKAILGLLKLCEMAAKDRGIKLVQG